MSKNTKKFIAQQGSNSTIKVFDASTGSLYRVINAGGTIVTPPVVSENQLSVNVKVGKNTMVKIFNLPSGSLKNNIVL